MTRRTAALLALTAVVALALVALPAAFAAKGGNRPGGGSNGDASVALVLSGDTNANGVPNHAETVTFSVTSSADQPFVNLTCYQGGALVYDAWAGFYDGAWFGRDYVLSSTSWTGGAADCTARLVTWSRNGRQQVHATLGFGVYA